ncbi:MAG: TonB-dependent receptor [Acidobacteria bacterium]|nr:TonB-dependent receptor [Acidobacteriota bacterium]
MLRRLLTAQLLTLLTAGVGFAQVPTTPRDPAAQAGEFDAFVLTYRFRFDTTHLDDLPHGGTVPTLLETAHGFLVADRIDGGGAFPASPAWLGGQGSAGAQTTYRLDGVDVTDPLTGGTPMLRPETEAIGTAVMNAASLDADAAGTGPRIDLHLRPMTDRWSGSTQWTFAPSAWQSGPPALPPISRLLSRTDGGAHAGGLAGRTAVFIAARATTADRVEREDPAVLASSAWNATGTITANPVDGHALRIVTAVSGGSAPLITRARFADRNREEDMRGLVAHASWDGLRAGTAWVITGGVQRYSTDADVPADAAGGVMERLRDGSPWQLGGTGRAARQRVFVQAAAAPSVPMLFGAEHHMRVGAGVARESARLDHGVQPLFGEMVDGVPARVWDLRTAGASSRLSNLDAHAFISDQMAIGDRLAVTAGARLEISRAAAEGAVDRVRWFTLSPRLVARWQPFTSIDLGITTGYSWYRHRLPLTVLSIGDPNGLDGTTYRWDDRNGDGAFVAGELTPIARLGLASATIDDDLQRPTTGEFRIGVEHAMGRWRWSVTGLDRRERSLLALVNTGVSPADYTVETIQDPGVDIAGLQGFNTLPIFNRRPESFGRDAYALSNTPGVDGRYQGVEIAVDHDTGGRWFFRFGGTAYRAEGIGTHRGYRADENDQGLPGEVFLTPNATINARGRLFYDRAYIMKVLGGVSLPRGLRASAIARYQDGQPFTRVVIADDLNQGRDLIPAYPRGGQRFTYTATLDTRVEWRWSRDARSAGVFIESFNLLNMANEVEEDIVTGPAFRTITAVQPPRVIRAGIRVGF